MKLVTFDFFDKYDDFYQTVNASFSDEATEEEYLIYGDKLFELFISSMIDKYGETEEDINEICKNSYWCYDDENIRAYTEAI